jgi:hypothetical protein
MDVPIATSNIYSSIYNWQSCLLRLCSLEQYWYSLKISINNSRNTWEFFKFISCKVFGAKRVFLSITLKIYSTMFMCIWPIQTKISSSPRLPLQVNDTRNYHVLMSYSFHYLGIKMLYLLTIQKCLVLHMLSIIIHHS